MKSARTFNGLSTQIFLWFWFILLLVVAAVVILPTLDPRNIIPLPAHEITRLNNNLAALQRGADPEQDFDLAKAIDAAGLLPVDNIYLRDAKGQMQSSTRLSKFVIRFMLDSDNPAKPMLGSEHQRAIAGPFQMVHHGQTYHVYFGLNVENSYLFLFIQILDHPIQILGIAMLVSTPLCLLLAWRLTRPILQLQQSVSQLAQGNLEIQIPNLGRRDEIGQLAEHVSRMVDTLKDMIQKQKQLLSDISHELRSPLTRIQLAQALIRRKQGDSNELARIESEIGRLDKLIGENGHLQPEDRSLIAASLKNIYKPLIASGYTAPCPTLGDLYRDLNKSNLRRAKQLALMLDVFANGSLQAFSHTTNVDMNNRLICFNIQSLGDQLRPIAMMSLLEFINMQVMTNRRKDATAATWIYFDEIHVLLKDPMSSNFLYSSWKRFRKYNAYATGISQDIQDYLDNPVAYALLSNSEFVIMLRQSKSLEALERLYGLSKPQLEFLRNASEGHGIIKMGNSMIPFSNLEPKDTAVYKLITTKPGEATAEK